MRLNFNALLLLAAVGFVAAAPVHGSLLDDPDGIDGELHIGGDPTKNWFSPALGSVPVGAGNAGGHTGVSVVDPGPPIEFQVLDVSNGFDVDFDDDTIWLTQFDVNSHTTGVNSWEMWFTDLEWGIEGKITNVSVVPGVGNDTFPGGLGVTWTDHAIHISFAGDPAAQADYIYQAHLDIHTTHVPEPSTFVLTGLGLGVAGLVAHRRKKAA